MIYKYKCERCNAVYHTQILEFKCYCGNTLNRKEMILDGFAETWNDAKKGFGKTK